jgi:16S rRNA processing protein RimM
VARPERLLIGRVAGAFGLRGELKVMIETDFPERFRQLKRVFVGGVQYEAESARLHHGAALLKLRGIDDANRALQLQRCDVEVALEDAVVLPAGRYFVYQIEGLRVETISGEALGVIGAVWQTGANDVYQVITPDRTEILLPAIPQVVKSVDLERGLMIVELLDGLR